MLESLFNKVADFPVKFAKFFRTPLFRTPPMYASSNIIIRLKCSVYQGTLRTPS